MSSFLPETSANTVSLPEVPGKAPLTQAALWGSAELGQGSQKRCAVVERTQLGFSLDSTTYQLYDLLRTLLNLSVPRFPYMKLVPNKNTYPLHRHGCYEDQVS